MDGLLARRRMMMVLYQEEYIVFADPEVERICAETWGDGIGLKPSQAARVTTIERYFNQNTLITSFNELVYFTSLTYFYGHNNVNYGVFAGCTALTSIVLPESFVTFGRGSFNNCSALESVTFPSGQCVLNANTFYGCSSLADLGKLRVSGFIESNRVFYNCSQLTELDFSESTFTSIPSSSASGNSMTYGCSRLTTVILPTTCTSLGNYLFYGRSSITSITGLDNVVSVGTYIFYRCYGLTSLNTPSLTSVGKNAFYQCTHLTSINLESVTTIGQGAFDGCTGLQEVTLLHITSIGSEAFRRCSSLTAFICGVSTPPTLGTNSFYQTTGVKIYVPYSVDHSVLAAYQAATNWSSYASQIYELDENGNIPS